MKFILLFFATLFFTSPVFSQNSWIVKSGKQILLKASKEDTVANVIAIKTVKKNSLTIIYNEAKRKDWSRYIMVYDEADNELLRKETHSITATSSQLKQWAKKNKQVKIYTIPRNLNPAIAIKMRRVHLCTLKFE